MYAKHGTVWQSFAREWHVVGNEYRADRCQVIADWWRMPWWQQLLELPRARQTLRELLDNNELADLVAILHQEQDTEVCGRR
jgi:hypothetical protein